MIRFDIITVFPDMFSTYLSASILGRAQKKNIASFFVHDLRKYTDDTHRTVDDAPYGGGAGMVMKVEPIFRAVSDIRQEKVRTLVLLMSAKGDIFTQQHALSYVSYEQIILICGRYEGVDERVAEYIADSELSVGSYVLTGGELPSLIVCDAVTRLLPGVLGNAKSLEGESYGSEYEKTFPQYTRPEVFQEWEVPLVLREGNHKEIEKWRRSHGRLNNMGG